jgi:hypothetical protein
MATRTTCPDCGDDLHGPPVDRARAVVGAVLLSPAALAAVKPYHVTVDHFTDPVLADVWRSIVASIAVGENVDVVTVSTRRPLDVNPGVLLDLMADCPAVSHAACDARWLVTS